MILLYRTLSTTCLIAWLAFAAFVVVMHVIYPAKDIVESMTFMSLLGMAGIYTPLFGLLPSAALFHIAAEVTQMRKHREHQHSNPRGTHA